MGLINIVGIVQFPSEDYSEEHIDHVFAEIFTFLLARRKERINHPEKFKGEKRESEIPQVDCSGFVYLMHNKESGLYKIGHSKNPIRRLANIRREMGVSDIDIIHIIQCSNRFDLESLLHQKYQKKRINREWFDLSLFDINEIISEK